MLHRLIHSLVIGFEMYSDICERIETNRWINNKERLIDLTWFTPNDYVHRQREILLMEKLQRSVYKKIRSRFSMAAN